MKEQEWKCPKCETENTDYRDTSFPLCEGCGKDFDWSEVTAK